MFGKPMIYFLAAILVIGLAFVGWKLTSITAYESAEYALLVKEGPFEIREYPELMVASTSMNFGSQGDDGSFGRLFRYISGGNQDKQKIAMTTPVFMEQGTSESSGKMGFVLPKKISNDSVPKPASAQVELTPRRGGKFAVIRFAGKIGNETVAAKQQELEGWVQAKGYNSDGNAEVAGYDPPWTPGMLRRNEVLIRIQ